MADFVELGLEAADHLIDHHFDDIPDQFFHPRTAVRSIRNRSHSKGPKYPLLDRLEGREEHPAESGSKDHPKDANHQPESQENSNADSTYRDGDYAYHDHPPGPRTDPYYHEAQRRTTDYYAPPIDPPQRDPRYPAQRRDPHAMEYNPPPNPYTWRPAVDPTVPTYQPQSYSPPRPSSPPRRTHSQKEPRGRRQRPKIRRRPSSTGPSHGLADAFSTSDRGLGAGGLGALAGGFLAQEIERRTGRGDPMLLTLVGAVVGGLGANFVEGRGERNRKVREREEGKRGREGEKGRR